MAANPINEHTITIDKSRFDLSKTMVFIFSLRSKLSTANKTVLYQMYENTTNYKKLSKAISKRYEAALSISNYFLLWSKCKKRKNKYNVAAKRWLSIQLISYEFLEVNECESSPCKNGAACRDMVGGYRCYCLAGYTGNNCDTSNFEYCKLSMRRTPSGPDMTVRLKEVTDF